MMKNRERGRRHISSPEADWNADGGLTSTTRVVSSEHRDVSEDVERARRGEALGILATVRHRRELLELEELSGVSRARTAGAKWAEIGTALRVSERVVAKKYGPLLRPQARNGSATPDPEEGMAL